ncbi:MAG TPA: hypothetical protein VFH56_14190 [Acidimicrobiales bacterium]|nr:hypothetical protein [Acidimicrobiales bacterium]
MRVQVTVEIDTTSKNMARAAVEDAGFTVVRVTAPKGKTAAVSSRSPFQRASSLMDMPTDLDRFEVRAYVKGYAKGCLTYVRKYGAPSITGQPVDRSELHRKTVEHEWDRHETAHKAGMRELAKYQGNPVRLPESLREAS